MDSKHCCFANPNCSMKKQCFEFSELLTLYTPNILPSLIFYILHHLGRSITDCKQYTGDTNPATNPETNLTLHNHQMNTIKCFNQTNYQMEKV